MSLVHSAHGVKSGRQLRSLLFHVYLDGYDKAAESAHAELLEENHALQSERIDLSLGQTRIVALEQLFNECCKQSCMHVETCECWLCKATDAVSDPDPE